MFKPWNDTVHGVVATLLLAGLVIVLAALVIWAFWWPPWVPAGPDREAERPATIEADLAALFTDAGFGVSEGPLAFDASNLYDRINGAAPAYIACGFEALTSFTLVDRSGKVEASADIFDMGRDRNAFGIFSLERAAAGSGEEFGGGSYRSDGTLLFWQDRYYVKLVAYDIGPHVDKALSDAAQVVSAAIPRPGAMLAAFDRFPGDDRLPHSERFIAGDWLGRAELGCVYTIDYAAGETEYTIALIESASDADAAADLGTLRAMVSEAGGVTDETVSVGSGAFSGSLSFYGDILAARRGSEVFVILGLDANKAAGILASVPAGE